MRVLISAMLVPPAGDDDAVRWTPKDRELGQAVVNPQARAARTPLTVEVIFADGWSCSVGCSVEFGLAALRRLPSYDAAFDSLSLARGIELLRSTVPRIAAAGGATSMQDDVVSTLTTHAP